MQPPLPSDTIPDGHKQPDTHPVVIWRKDKDAQSTVISAQADKMFNFTPGLRFAIFYSRILTNHLHLHVNVGLMLG